MTFKIFSVPVKISFLFPAAITFLMVTSIKEAALISFVSAFFHELGHLFAIKKLGGKIKNIEFGAFGGRITLSGESGLTLKGEAAAAFAGPVVNFIFSAVFLVCFLFTGNKSVLLPLAINLGMGFFNLFPISTLDGGRIFSALLHMRFSDRTCDIVLNTVSAIFLLIILFFGFLLIMRKGGNFSLLVTCSYLVIFGFIRAAD